MKDAWDKVVELHEGEIASHVAPECDVVDTDQSETELAHRHSREFADRPPLTSECAAYYRFNVEWN